MRTLTHEEKLKLTNIIDEGIKILQEVQDLKDGLKDAVTSIAEELDVKPALINKAIRVAHKHNLGEQKDSLTEVEEILATIGRKV